MPAEGVSTVLDVDTSLGPARVHCDVPPDAFAPLGRLVLGHGAGGGVQAPDLLAARDAAVAAGWAVARVEQPWRVAGRRVAAAPARLDVGWLEVLAALCGAATGDPRGGVGGEAFAPGTPLVCGGRSAGARVACRTCDAVAADAVLCLAFPLRFPGGRGTSRALELPGDRPLMVLQGARDPFGTPDDVRAEAPPGVEVVTLAGDHSLRMDRSALQASVGRFLASLRR